MPNYTQPKFSFKANSCSENDQSGVATWTYHEVSSRRQSNLSVELAKFSDAHAINELLTLAWNSGHRAGALSAKQLITSALSSID